MTIANVLPYWGRVTLSESPVDETELGSGLVLPHKHDQDGGVSRGIVLAVDRLRDEPTESGTDIAPGTVVYYRNGVTILDVVVVERRDILAYEEPHAA